MGRCKGGLSGGEEEGRGGRDNTPCFERVRVVEARHEFSEEKGHKGHSQAVAG